MLLAIDAGNTNTVFAVFAGDTIKGQWRISASASRTADEYAVWLLQMMQAASISPKDITASIAACVVPQSLYELRQLAERYFATDLLVVGEDDVKCGVGVKVDSPGEVGADRIVNAYAACKRYKAPLVVVDFGTATTFDVVDTSGDYVGGVIAPGINLSLDALHRAAARLPNVPVAPPAKVVGTNTVAAIQSGIYFGYGGLIEGVLARIREELGGSITVIATGGLAALYAKEAHSLQHLEPDLTMHGLNDIYQLNKAGS